MMLQRQLLLPLLTVACGSDLDVAAMCAERSGTYRVNFIERTGTCGPIPEQIDTLDEQPVSPPPPCTAGEIRYSEDNCEVTNIDVTCPEEGVQRGATSVLNGKYKWEPDGSRAAGQANLVVKDAQGLVICQSSYNVVVTRL